MHAITLCLLFLRLCGDSVWPGAEQYAGQCKAADPVGVGIGDLRSLFACSTPDQYDHPTPCACKRCCAGAGEFLRSDHHRSSFSVGQQAVLVGSPISALRSWTGLFPVTDEDYCDSHIGDAGIKEQSRTESWEELVFAASQVEALTRCPMDVLALFTVRARFPLAASFLVFGVISFIALLEIGFGLEMDAVHGGAYLKMFLYYGHAFLTIWWLTLLVSHVLFFLLVRSCFALLVLVASCSRVVLQATEWVEVRVVNFTSRLLWSTIDCGSRQVSSYSMGLENDGVDGLGKIRRCVRIVERAAVLLVKRLLSGARRHIWFMTGRGFLRPSKRLCLLLVLIGSFSHPQSISAFDLGPVSSFSIDEELRRSFARLDRICSEMASSLWFNGASSNNTVVLRGHFRRFAKENCLIRFRSASDADLVSYLIIECIGNRPVPKKTKKTDWSFSSSCSSETEASSYACVVTDGCQWTVAPRDRNRITTDGCCPADAAGPKISSKTQPKISSFTHFQKAMHTTIVAPVPRLLKHLPTPEIISITAILCFLHNVELKAKYSNSSNSIPNCRRQSTQTRLSSRIILSKDSCSLMRIKSRHLENRNLFDCNYLQCKYFFRFLVKERNHELCHYQ